MVARSIGDILPLLTVLRYDDYFSFLLWECHLIALVLKEIFTKKISYRLGSVSKYRKFTQICSPFLLRIQDFAVTARSCHGILLYFPSAMWAFLPPLDASQVFLYQNWTPSASRWLSSKAGIWQRWHWSRVFHLPIEIYLKLTRSPQNF